MPNVPASQPELSYLPIVSDIIMRLWRPLPPALSLTEAGLDSLTAVRIQRECALHTGIRLPLTSFLGDASVSSIAALLAAESENSDSIALQGGDSSGSTGHSVPEGSAPLPQQARGALTPVQATYWVGRGTDYPLGGVSPRFYGEYELPLSESEIPRLSAAWQEVVRKHGMLRATVDSHGIQHIGDAQEHPIPVHYGDPLLTRARLAHRVPDLQQWPVHDVEITVEESGLLRVHLGFEVILLDFLGIQTVLDDWGKALAGQPLEPHTTEFLDIPHPEPSEADLKYWKAKRLPPAPFRPTEHSSPNADPDHTSQTPTTTSQQERHFTRHSARIPAQLWKHVQECAAHLGASPSGALLAVAAHALHAAGAPQEFSLATTFFTPPAAGAPESPDSRELPVGDYTTTGVVTVENRGTFAQRACAATQELWETLDHSTVTSAQIGKIHNQNPMVPAYPVVFTSAIGHAGAQWPGRLTWGVTQTPQVLMDLLHWEEGDDLFLAWDCVDNLLPPQLAERALSVATSCLTALAEPAAWHEPIRDPWLRTTEPVPEKTLDLTQNSDTPAVIAADGAWTHRELQEHIRKVAESVQRAGAELVLVMMRKSRSQVAAVAGILRAGAAYIPVDPEWPEARIQSVIRRSEVQWCMVDHGTAAPEGLRTITPGHASDTEAEIPSSPARSAGGLQPPSPHSLAYAIFTSGSTGEPKGVAIEHRQAAATLGDVDKRFRLSSTDRVLGVSALSFDLSVWDIFGVLSAGGSIVLPDDTQPRDPAMWVELIAQHGVTIWNSAPALLEMLVDYAELDPAASSQALRTLRLVMLSGDWIPVTLPGRLRKLVPTVEIYSLGGATEAAIWSICHRIEPADEQEVSIPYGRALTGQYFRILDDAARPVGVGQPGHLYIGGAGVARGYLGDSEKAAERFVDLGERLYDTGDLGMWLDNGEIRFLGRDDRQVKINGFRIELGEIDAALSRSGWVKNGVCVADSDRAGTPRLVAHIVPRDREGFSEEALRKELRDLLPGYMIPAQCQIHQELPVTPNGKIDYKALVGDAQAASCLLRADTIDNAQTPNTSGRTPTELGIDSLEIIRVVNRIEERTGVRPPLAEIYRSPWEDTVRRAQEGQAVEAAAHAPMSNSPASPVCEVPASEGPADSWASELTALAAQCGGTMSVTIPRRRNGIGESGLGEVGFGEQMQAVGAWLSNHPDAEVTFSNGEAWCQITWAPPERTHGADTPFDLTPLQQAYLVGTQGDLPFSQKSAHFYVDYWVPEITSAQVAEAIRLLVEEQPMLRAVITPNGQQKVLAADELQTSLTTVKDVQHLRQTWTQEPLDPQHWPNFRVGVCESASGLRLCVQASLLFFDGWSFYLFFERLLCLAHNPAARKFPQLTFQRYQELAAHPSQRHRDEQWWHARLPHLPPSPHLPVTEVTNSGVRRASARISKDSILRGALEIGVSPAALIGAAWAEVICELTGDSSFLLAVLYFNRQDIPGARDVLGPFSTTTLIPAGGSPAAFAESLAEAISHNTVSGVEVARMLSSYRGTSGVVAPVVFTSNLGFAGSMPEGIQEEDGFERIMTPSVVLDLQAAQIGDVVELNLDSPVGAFEEGLPQRLVDSVLARVATTEPILLDDGAGAPLYLLHPSGGSITCYLELAQRLPMPVYGIADPGLYELSAPTAIEDLSRFYGRSLMEFHRAHYDTGFYLGGWSMGGTVAQSVVHWFQNSPESHAESAAASLLGLIMMDSHSPDRIRHVSGINRAEVDAEFARRYVNSLHQFSQDTASSSQEGLQVFTRHLIGLADMTAPVATGIPTLLVIAADHSPVNSGVGMGVDDARGEKLLGWDGKLPDDAVTVHVPGHHYSMLRVSVDSIAEALVHFFERNCSRPKKGCIDNNDS